MTAAPDTANQKTPTTPKAAAVKEPDQDQPDSLCHDITCVLIQCHRDRQGDGIFNERTSAKTLGQFAAVVARRLAPMIGGRYIPKRDVRAERDAAVWQAFNGRNHKEVMAHFCISRRLLYSILARKRKG